MSQLGRPATINLNEEEIAKRIGEGYTVEWVAEYFGVHENTLYTRYSGALKKGYAYRNGCLQAKQYEMAMSGNPTMCIWLGKQWLKQRDKHELEVSNREVTFGDLPDPFGEDRPRETCQPN